MAMPTMGSTAPATPYGAITVGDAEVISAMVLIQLAFPGAPVYYANLISLMEPRTGGYIGEVPYPFPYIVVQLAHAWGVPCLGGGSTASDSAEVDWQSALESGMGALQIPLAGGEVCGYLGMAGSSMILYHEKIILEHEMCQMAVEHLQANPVREEDFAFDVVKTVGPGGHFLREKHTAKHLRDFRLSPLLRQRDAEGKERDPREVAMDEFKRLNDSHHPEPLPEEILKEMDRILTATDRQIG
jgi:trimethylamine--corrinoid protein Co-methyltransferase